MSLTVGKIEKILAQRGVPGWKPRSPHPDDNGLHLIVSSPDAASWAMRYQLRGKRTWIGLGTLDVHHIKEDLDRARRECHTIKLELAKGIDPQQKRQDERDAVDAAALSAKTFQEVAEEYMEKSPVFLGLDSETRDNWHQRLRDYAYPVIGHRSVKNIGPAAVIEVMDQDYSGVGAWRDKKGRFSIVAPWAAENTRTYIATVIAYAKQKEYRPLEDFNPADRKNISLSVPELAKPKPKYHDYHEIPAFVARVREYQKTTWGGGGTERSRQSGVAATLLIMLTASRIGVTVGAEWDDFDLSSAIWKIPKVEQKKTRGQAQKELDVYQVPLAPQAVELLSTIPREGKYVFPGLKASAHISRTPVDTVLNRAGFDHHTPHAFRKFFSTWANDYTWGTANTSSTN